MSSLFLCDSCKISIQGSHPRIHCLVCHDFDLCANCAIGEKLPYGHLPQHAIEVYKESGYSTNVNAMLSEVTISYAASNVQLRQSADLASIQFHRGPPPPIPARADVPFPSPTTNSQQEIMLALSGWEPFFLPDTTPTLTYMTLANEIFTYLDPGNVGILVPETLSRFLDDMGYPPNENYWKNGSMRSLEITEPDMSTLSDRDKALRNIFEINSIEHHLLPRPSAPQVIPTMPAVTRRGFISVTSIDLLTDPSRQWEYMDGILKKYNLPIYQRLGDLPRTVLPFVPQQAMVDRVDNAQAGAAEKRDTERGNPEGDSLSVEDQLHIQLKMIELQSRLSSMHAASQSFSNHLLMNSLNTIRY